VDCIPELGSKKSVALFAKHNVLSAEELHSRVEIYLEKYAKTINIEAGIQIEMVKKNILPAAIDWLTGLAGSIEVLDSAKVPTSGAAAVLKEAGALVEKSYKALATLESKLAKTRAIDDIHKKAGSFRKDVFAAMSDVRREVDALERLMPADFYPYPTYEDMLFRF
jgi:glutamine synthetase